MEGFYKLLNWITLNQALELIEKVTNQSITGLALTQLCDDGHCAAYVKVNDCDGYQRKTYREIQPNGYHKVVNVVTYRNRFNGSYLIGQVEGEENIEWIPKDNYFGKELFFKPIDICSLIEKINGTPVNGTPDSEPINQPSKPKRFDPRERTSYDRLVYVLAKKAGFDLDSDKGITKSRTLIARYTESLGLRALSSTTLDNLLKSAKKNGGNN